MTLDEFITALEHLDRKRLQFEVDADGNIRTKDSWCHCPITAVCQEKTGVRYVTRQFRGAARELRLGVATADRIAGAADAKPSSLTPYRGRIRSRIISALGLKEAA